MQERATRRLAAIVAADVAGYSRLIGADEEGTLAALRAHRRELIDPLIEEYGGRIANTAGDSLLVEFPSAVDAVRCALAVQRGMAERTADADPERRILFRVGINVGDVVAEGDDLLGDGVNLAARLEQVAEPGGIAVSARVHEDVRDRLDAVFEDEGEQSLKNITRPVRIWRWRGADAVAPAPTAGRSVAELNQEVRFCVARDGATIAYAKAGSGPPLVRAAHWFTHLEHEWPSPIWRQLLLELSAGHTLYRYDQRGTGLSDWDVGDISFDAWVGDMETVMDAAGLDRFALLGISQGCPLSIAYAVRHPERVSRLVLYGGYAKGWLVDGSEAAAEQHAAMRTLLARGWGRDTSALRRMFTSLFIPNATSEEYVWFSELQRLSTTAETGVRIFDIFPTVDVSDLLSQVTVPTLVLHCRDDAAISYKAGRRMAAMIPNARFVTLESESHLLLSHEAAFTRFVEEVRNFLADDDRS